MFQNQAAEIRATSLERGVLVEHDERIVFVNRPYAAILGHEPKTLRGEHISCVVSETDSSRLLDYGRRRMTGHQAPARYSFLARRKDGSPVPVLARVSSSFDVTGYFIKTVLQPATEAAASEEKHPSLEAMFDRFAPCVYAALLRMVQDPNDASAILMESFSVAAKENVPVSLARLLSDAASRAQRHGRVRSSELPVPEAQAPTPTASPDSLLFEEWEARRARSSLTPIERQAIELAYFDKLPIEAIAKFLNTSQEEVRQSLVSAMRRLRSLRFVDDEGVTPVDF